MGTRRGKIQLLPTPQNSTTSSTKEETLLFSSEVDDEEEEVIIKRRKSLRSAKSNVNSNVNSNISSNSISSNSGSNSNSNSINSRNSNSCSSKPSCSIKKSSWPYRSNSREKFMNFSIDSTIKISSKDSLKLKRLIQRDFPYDRVIKKLSKNSYNLLFDKEFWKFLLKISTIYTGEEVQGDLQKRNEVAFAAWTTLLRVYGGRSRVRGGEERLEGLAVASIVLQAKLLEESDVDLLKLEKKLMKLTTRLSCEKKKIELLERKICSLLEWKLLVPSPQVILFSSLDALNLPSNLKLLVSKVLDELIEDFLLQEYLITNSQNGNSLLSKLVVSVIEIVLCDFFSVFKGGNQFDVETFLKANLSVETSNLTSNQREKIEKALETVMKFHA